jgi:hypothetical protein
VPRVLWQSVFDSSGSRRTIACARTQEALSVFTSGSPLQAPVSLQSCLPTSCWQRLTHHTTAPTSLHHIRRQQILLPSSRLPRRTPVSAFSPDMALLHSHKALGSCPSQGMQYVQVIKHLLRSGRVVLASSSCLGATHQRLTSRVALQVAMRHPVVYRLRTVT